MLTLMGFGLTPLFGDRHGFMPPQLKTKQTKLSSSFLCQTIEIGVPHFSYIVFCLEVVYSLNYLA
jgi:hypothetical protein